MAVMATNPVRLVFLNPETEVREKQRFIDSESYRQGQIHKMGMGHSEPSRRGQHNLGKVVLFHEDNLKVVLVHLAVYFEQ
jgi:hypothetical protein